MKEIPKSTYIKLLVILALLFLMYNQHEAFIQATLSNEQLSQSEKVEEVFKEVMGIDGNSRDEELEVQEESEEEAGFEEARDTQKPIQFGPEITSHPNYQEGLAVAENFNANLSIPDLNQAFLTKTNAARAELGYVPVEIGEHLHHGVQSRVNQLADYNYLANETIHGNNFRTMFPYVENPDGRLGESLYELYIAASDVHVKTWENPDILADYLLEALADNLLSEEVQDYRYQYVYVQMAPTDMNINETAYVRLVVSVIFDKGE